MAIPKYKWPETFAPFPGTLGKRSRMKKVNGFKDVRSRDKTKRNASEKRNSIAI